MPKFRIHLQSSESQYDSTTYKAFMLKTQVLKLSKSVFEIVKECV